jgi:hypothetical protein
MGQWRRIVRRETGTFSAKKAKPAAAFLILGMVLAWQALGRAALVDSLRLADSPVGVPAMPWWGYVLLAVLVLAAAAFVLPRVGRRGK